MSFYDLIFGDSYDYNSYNVEEGPSYNVGQGPSYNVSEGPSYNVSVGPSYNVGEGPSSSNVEEGQSGIRYRDNAVQLDLNTQWKDPYEFEDEPSQPAYGYTYDANRGDDTSEEQDYTHYEDSAVDEKRVEDQEEGPNPINPWFETNRTFSTRDVKSYLN